VLTPITLVTKQYDLLIGVLATVIITSLILKFSWWNKLDEASQETLPADFQQRVAAVLDTSSGKPSPGMLDGLAPGKATVS